MDWHPQIGGRVQGVSELQLIHIGTSPIILYDREMEMDPNSPGGVPVIISGVAQ